MVTDFAAFLGISVLLIVAPGQDTALTIRNALFGGQRVGVFTACGVATGLAVWAIATSIGLATLLLASEPVFVALKLAGAAYLLVLGARALSGALRGGELHSTVTGAVPRRPVVPWTAYRQGVVSNLGNPKIAVFFSSLLPQFTPNGEASFGGLLLLGLVFSVLTLVWLTGYAAVVAKAGDFLRRSNVRRALDGIMGAVLIALGLRLATEQR